MKLCVPHSGTFRCFVKDGAGVDETECEYQCRGRASVFRTGHCVGFVVDLQGQCRGHMTHMHTSCLWSTPE